MSAMVKATDMTALDCSFWVSENAFNQLSLQYQTPGEQINKALIHLSQKLLEYMKDG